MVVVVFVFGLMMIGLGFGLYMVGKLLILFGDFGMGLLVIFVVVLLVIVMFWLVYDDL